MSIIIFDFNVSLATTIDGAVQVATVNGEGCGMVGRTINVSHSRTTIKVTIESGAIEGDVNVTGS